MASCNCIKGNFDVDVTYNSCAELIIEDWSDWMVEDQIYEKPESYQLSIKTPNKSQEYTITVLTDKRNRYSPSDIGISSKNLTDGIYCFKVESCGSNYQRNKMITCSVECCIEDAIAKLKNREEILLLDEIRMILDSSKINTEIGNLTKAKEQYHMVTKMLRKLNCSCS